MCKVQARSMVSLLKIAGARLPHHHAMQVRLEEKGKGHTLLEELTNEIFKKTVAEREAKGEKLEKYMKAKKVEATQYSNVTTRYHTSIYTKAFSASITLKGKSVFTPHFFTAGEAAWARNKLLLENRADIPTFTLVLLQAVPGCNFEDIPGYVEAKEEEAEYTPLLRSMLTHGTQWRKEEDAELIKLVGQSHAAFTWPEIEKQMSTGRLADSCRHRWEKYLRHLNPDRS